MSKFLTEDHVEQASLAWLVALGWEVGHGPDVSPPDAKTPGTERDTYREVTLKHRLRDTIRRLNPHIPASAQDEAARMVQSPNVPGQVQANRQMHRWLVEGVPVQYQKDGETRGDRVKLVDWVDVAGNDWLALNQFSVQGPKLTRRPDVVLFLNGLPVVVVELKNPGDENADLWAAFNQLQAYKEDIPDLFIGNALLVISDGIEARMGSLTADQERFMAWRTIDGVSVDPLGPMKELETLVRELLANRPSGGIIFTTIQKFTPGEDEDSFPILSDRHNIVVICDEAHRSQYGFQASMPKLQKQLKDARKAPAANEPLAFQAAEPTAEYGGLRNVRYGYAQHLRDGLPNATFVAFTGTPVSLEDRDTRAVFGDYVHIYDVEQAVKDGATVPIYYESRLARLELQEAEAPKLDDEVEELTEDEEDDTAKAAQLRRWAALEKLVGAPPRIQKVAADLVEHFENRLASLDGKAMVVAMSREICVHLYDAIVALRPSWHDPDPEKGAIKVIMTGSASDKALLKPHIYSKDVKKRLERRYKDPADPFKLVIVRDMWLTGFDAPCMHTMYVDKPMKGHSLMQAIARVNRVFKDKPGGLVVDYIGIANELKAALKDYTQAKGKGKPTIAAEDALAVLLEKMDVLHDMLHGFDYTAFRTQAWQLLPGVANHILGLEDGKKRFADTVLAASKAFALCCTLDEALIHRDELAFLQAVKAALTKFGTSGKKLSDEQKEHALRQIISKAVVSAEVVDIFKAAGLNRPDIGILSEEFLEDVRHMKERNLAVELLERLLRDDIRSRFKTNVVQQAKFSELLQQSLQRYRNRAIETAQVIEELIEMAKKFHAAAMRGEQLGLNGDEMAFYDALATNEAAVRELGDETLKAIAVELTQKLRASVTVDWSVRETVRARLRVMVKTLLKRYKYPPDRQDEATETVLRQAESLSSEWVSS